MSIRRSFRLSFASLLVLTFAASAFGQMDNWRDNPIKKMILEQYDKNNDGRLGPEEWQTIKKDFQSGKLELPPGVRERVQEWLAAQPAPKPERNAKPGRPDSPRRGPSSLSPEILDKVAIQRDVEYGRAGDRSLKLDLVYPKSASDKPRPVVVFIHGGGWQGGSKSAGIPQLAMLALKEDYFCASVDYRLSGEAIWPAPIHDCKAAIRWLRAKAKKYNLDPDKIGVWGSSAGGHLVSLLGTSGGVKELEGPCGSPDQSSRVTCVVDFCGPSDFSAISESSGAVAPVTRLLGGPLEEKKDEAKAASPVTYVSHDDPPFLIVHGDEDHLVPMRQAETLHAALQKAGVSSILLKVEGCGHGIGGPEVAQRVTDFFAKHLRGKDVEISEEPVKFASAGEKPASGKRRARP
jgi:acetyl esterase/lipase